MRGSEGLPFGQLFSARVTAEGAGSKEAVEGGEAIPRRRGLHVRAAAAVRLVMAADLRAVQVGLLSPFIISCRRKSSPVPGSLRHRRTSVAQVSEGLELPFPQNYTSKPSFSE